MKQWFHWSIIRPWPLWSLIVVISFVAVGGDWTLHSDGPGFNKIVGASLQAVGALLVLFSLDGSVGLFKGRGIIAEALKWALDYPRKPRSIILEARASSQSNSSASGALTIRPSTIDGRVAEIERNIVELRSLISTRHNELQDSITAARAEALKAIDRTTNDLRDLEAKVVVSAVGGMKVQIFGVGLALVGSVLSVFS
jgi:hypothetical protein